MASHFLSRVRHGVRRLHSTLKDPRRRATFSRYMESSRRLALGGECGVSWVGILVTDGIWLRRRVNLRLGRKISSVMS